jgi:hypothetical protein
VRLFWSSAQGMQKQDQPKCNHFACFEQQLSAFRHCTGKSWGRSKDPDRSGRFHVSSHSLCECRRQPRSMMYQCLSLPAAHALFMSLRSLRVLAGQEEVTDVRVWKGPPHSRTMPRLSRYLAKPCEVDRVSPPDTRHISKEALIKHQGKRNCSQPWSHA